MVVSGSAPPPPLIPYHLLPHPPYQDLANSTGVHPHHAPPEFASRLEAFLVKHWGAQGGVRVSDFLLQGEYLSHNP